MTAAALSSNNIAQRIATEQSISAQQVAASIALLDDGATVPFISRYRKEATGGLDDLQLRDLELRLRYLREMEERAAVIISSIAEQEKLTPLLEEQIRSAETKTELEDIYLPFKPKRRTKAMIAIEAGLEPLAETLFEDPSQDPEALALSYIDTDAKKNGIETTAAALEGARYILMDRISEDAALVGKLRSHLWEKGELRSRVVEAKKIEAAKFSDYFDYSERLNKIPSHRALAVFRGRKEGFLTVEIGSAGVESGATDPCESMIAKHFGIENKGRPGDNWLLEVVNWTWKIKLNYRLETDLLGNLREQSDDEAIRVFTENMKAILLASPAGNRVTLGLDPGLRTGVKVCVVDRTGKFLEDAAIFPHAPRNQWDESIAVLAKLAKKHGAELIAIGNGTASRETDKLASDLMKRHKDLSLDKALVNEAGASVYSASDVAREEFPDLDVTVRGAISIARRLQDPLAELVKLDPKSIGVGQYQHDVNQIKLGQSLNAVVEDCVNGVGVNVNMASAALLKQVSGLSASIASNIVAYRNQHGEYKTRQALKAVPRFGEKSFEQAAGFLRIVDGENPLDASAVHPESYSVVEKILSKNNKKVSEIIGDRGFLSGLDPAEYTDEKFGLPTVTDILAELEKPGRDPRPEFQSAVFKEGVESINDLEAGMTLEGVVTNVTNFGAFIDIGVHQDGLVHISAMSNSFVKDPHAVVKTGDVVKVKVMQVELQRKRIALSMRLDDEVESQSADTKREGVGSGKSVKKRSESQSRQKPKVQDKPAVGSFGALLQSAVKNKN